MKRGATRIKGKGLKPLLKLERIQKKRREATKMMLFWDKTKDIYFNGGQCES